MRKKHFYYVILCEFGFELKKKKNENIALALPKMSLNALNHEFHMIAVCQYMSVYCVFVCLTILCAPEQFTQQSLILTFIFVLEISFQT